MTNRQPANEVTRRNMRCTVCWSRWYLLPQLIIALGVDVVLFVYRAEIPMVVLAGCATVLTGIGIACLWAMVLRRPVLTIDDAGINCHRKRLPIIHWGDVVSVERLPRVRPVSPVESVSCLREAWRPIRLWVRGRPENIKITIEFMGMDMDSAKVYEHIQSRLSQGIGKQ